MNPKQAAPLAVTLAPLIAVAPQLFAIGALGCGIYFGLKWLLSEDKDKKPEAAPASASAAPERTAFRPQISGEEIIQKCAIPANSAGNTVRSPAIPPVSAGKTASLLAPIPSVSCPASVPAVPKILISPPSVIPAAKIQPEIPQPARNKIISREDMAKIFSSGRGLTRKSAVSTLKALGYGKTAAYQALEINGRFAPWLQFASDGIITWKN